jgi:hypothetical protein
VDERRDTRVKLVLILVREAPDYEARQRDGFKCNLEQILCGGEAESAIYVRSRRGLPTLMPYSFLL